MVQGRTRPQCPALADPAIHQRDQALRTAGARAHIRLGSARPMRVWCAFAYLFRLGLRPVAFEACSAASGLQRNVLPECGRKRLEGARGRCVGRDGRRCRLGSRGPRAIGKAWPRTENHERMSGGGALQPAAPRSSLGGRPVRDTFKVPVATCLERMSGGGALQPAAPRPSLVGRSFRCASGAFVLFRLSLGVAAPGGTLCRAGSSPSREALQRHARTAGACARIRLGSARPVRVWCAFATLFRLGLRPVAFEACSAAPGLQRNVLP